MRLLEVHPRAYGPFDAPPPIELPDVDGPGLCVLYGPNEAGKSSLLRALKALFYGIPGQTEDAFLHEYGALRIAARLRFDDGERFAFTRRKRNKDPIFDHDDRAPIEAERLARLVEAVPESLFERFYGLDPAQLRDGAAALLADDGEVGRALFGASLGVANVRSVLDELAGEAAELFAPRASKPTVNAALADWKRIRKELDGLTLDPQSWSEQSEAVERGTEAVAALEEALRQAREALARTERLELALADLARRRACRDRLAELGEVRPLPEDFSERLMAARGRLHRARDRRAQADERLERERATSTSLAPDPALVEAREAIEALHAGIEGHVRTLDQLPRRESELTRIEHDVETLLGGDARLDADRLARLRESVAREGSTRSHAAEGVRLIDRAQNAREALQDATLALERLQAEPVESDAFAEVSEADALRLTTTLEAAQALGPVDARIREAEAALASIDENILQARGRLGLVDAPRDGIEATAYPDHDWIDAQVRRFAEQATARARLEEDREAIVRDQRRVDEALRKLASSGELVRPEALADERAERERAWQALRADAIDLEAPVPLEARRRLAGDYERRVADADAIGDRLRVDAERVAERAAREAERDRLRAEHADLEDRLERAAAEAAALETEWADAWRRVGVEPGPRETMRAWRRGLDGLLEALARRREQAAALEREQQARRDARADLESALAAPGWAWPGAEVDPLAADSLAPIVARAQRARKAIGDARAERVRRQDATRQAESHLARARHELDRAEAALSGWREAWTDTVALLGLPSSARPEQVTEQLVTNARLLERLEERDKLVERIEGMRREVERFEARATGLVERCAPALAGRPASEAASALNARLAEALQQQTLLRRSEEAIEEATEARAEATVELTRAEQELAELCDRAGVAEADDLDEALRLWQQFATDTATLQEVEERLAQLAAPRSIEALEADAEATDAAALSATKAETTDRIEVLSAEHRAAVATLRSEQDKLDALDGSAAAAELAELAESALARARRAAERYVDLVTARRLLEEEIERHRREHEAPLLEAASAHFASLTAGAYARVATDLAPEGEGVRLVAVAADGREKGMPALSAGTRDQLFLALRLAALESSLGRRESMPLIADDLLIEFDDERTRATLETLAELGRKTQILLLSHHRHVLEIAEDLGDRIHTVAF